MALRGVDALRGELEKAKHSLKDVEKDIAKLTGRDPTEPRGPRRSSDGGDQTTGRGRGEDDLRSRGRLFNAARRGLTSEDGPSPAKRRAVGGAFSRLGPRVALNRQGPRLEPRQEVDTTEDEELKHRLAVQSSVVAGPAVNRSREDVAQDLNKDRESKGRNRRMFGLLLGTLQRFKDEEKQKVDKESQRKAVEEKLELKAIEEREELKRERKKLFRERQKKEEKIKLLEQKMELVDIHKQWEAQTQMLGNFIRLQSKPPIYYMPKTHVPLTKDRLKQTKDFLEKTTEERRQHLEEEIEELTKEAERKENDPSNDSMEMEGTESKEGGDNMVESEKSPSEGLDGKGVHSETENMEGDQLEGIEQGIEGMQEGGPGCLEGEDKENVGHVEPVAESEVNGGKDGEGMDVDKTEGMDVDKTKGPSVDDSEKMNSLITNEVLPQVTENQSATDDLTTEKIQTQTKSDEKVKDEMKDADIDSKSRKKSHKSDRERRGSDKKDRDASKRDHDSERRHHRDSDRKKRSSKSSRSHKDNEGDGDRKSTKKGDGNEKAHADSGKDKSESNASPSKAVEVRKVVALQAEEEEEEED